MHYIIITHNVSNLGGGQLYTLRRARHLLSKGYTVSIIDQFPENNFILKDQFRGCTILHYPELFKPIAFFSQRKSTFIIKKIIQDLNIKETEILIETHAFELGVWGERIAIELRAKHLIYCYEEWSLIKDYWLKPGKEFLIRKYKTNEFYGCTSQSIKILFGDIFKKNNFINVPFDSTEIKERTEPKLYLHPEENLYTITTVARLEKTYIVNLINDVAKFSQSHRDKSFRLIIGGDSKDKITIEQINDFCRRITQENSNLIIILPGYIKILGEDLFNITDVFVGMGTASINAISQGVITINIDPLYNNLSSGIFGIDTNNAAFSENGSHYTIYEKLEEVYNLNIYELEKYKNISKQLFINEFSTSSNFTKLDNAIMSIRPAQYNTDIEYSLFHHLYIKTLMQIRKLGGIILRKFRLIE